ncbi:unnamed protein product [Rotaria magnacalcarata]|uniref:Uncharacterized protein n=2 Tax=Rotaria magnacalcarata TaxID=392030 RepID=A0A814IE36_9BILA|nr:unnamed protein product [Rotaria magnacalcarata]CAF4419884.1 unnamed protein product [Rotaria magnacalcarata]CAF4720878.1 unnamed protein product [Rotaria magnacalcarata]
MMIVDLNDLTDEVLFYPNDQFYKFIEDCLGVDEMNLLNLQSIKNIRTLLNLPDVFSMFSINCKELVDLKNSICFVDEDNNKNIMVKSGIKAGIDNLITTLKEKNNKYIKRTKNFKSPSSLSSTTNCPISNTYLSNIPNSDSVDLSLTSTPLTAPNLLPINDYIDSISNSVEKFSINTFTNIILKNNDDYAIFLTLLHANIDGRIKCGCSTTIKLGFRLNRNSFQLSSYFKHLKNSHCSMIKKKKQVLIENLNKNNNLSDDLLQNEDFRDMNDDTGYEEDSLNDDNNSSQITANTSISRNSCSIVFHYLIAMASMERELLPFLENISSYSDDVFYAFVKEFVGDVESEILEIQRIKNVRILLQVPDVFIFLQINSKDILKLKERACFVTNDLQYIIRPGIKSNLEQFIETLRKYYKSTSNNENFVSSQTTANVIKETTHCMCHLIDIYQSNRAKSFINIFVSNLLKNMTQSSNNYQFDPIVNKFASVFNILAGNNAYEFIRLNLPGSLPST